MIIGKKGCLDVRVGELYKCEKGRGILEVVEVIDSEYFILRGNSGQYKHHRRDIGKTITPHKEKKNHQIIRERFHYDALKQAEYNKKLYSRDSKEDIDIEIQNLKRIQKVLNKEAEILEEKIYSLPGLYQSGAQTKDDFNSLFDQKNSKIRLLSELDAIISVEENPYICKLETISNEYSFETFYIGKRDHNYHNQPVYSWQSNIGSMYYRKSMRDFRINSVNYQLKTRRDYNISHCVLKDVAFISYDTDSSSSQSLNSSNDFSSGVYDEFLLEIIKNQRIDESVKEIISTIQEKQYNIISESHMSNLLIQGCAGSGKTMILLHRLSYMLYNKYFEKKDLIILTPNDGLSEFISPIVHELDLDGIRIKTFFGYMEEIYKQLTNKSLKFNQTNEISIDIQKDLISKFNDYIIKLISDYIDKHVDTQLHNLLRRFASVEGYESLSLKSKQKAYKDLCTQILRTEESFHAETCRKLKDSIEILYSSVSLKNDNIKILKTNIETCEQIVEENNLKFEKLTKESKTLFSRVLSLTNSNVDEINSLKAINNSMHEKIDIYNKEIEKHQSSIQIINYQIENAKLMLKLVKNRDYKDTETDYLMKSIKELIKVDDNKNSYLLAQSEILYLNNKVQKLDREFSPEKAIDYFLKEINVNINSKHLRNKLKLIYWIKYTGIKSNIKLVMIDEAQDYSLLDFEIIKMVCGQNPVFNLFGDTNQTLFEQNENWSQISDTKNYIKFNLNENYRNSNEITNFYRNHLRIYDIPIGIFDKKVQHSSNFHDLVMKFKEINGKKVILFKEQDYHNKISEVIDRMGVNLFGEIEFLTVAASKGMEFNTVLVVSTGMSKVEKYIAYTRARSNLYVFEGKLK